MSDISVIFIGSIPSSTPGNSNSGLVTLARAAELLNILGGMNRGCIVPFDANRTTSVSLTQRLMRLRKSKAKPYGFSNFLKAAR